MKIVLDFLLEYRYFVGAIVILAVFVLFLVAILVRRRRRLLDARDPSSPAASGEWRLERLTPYWPSILVVLVGVVLMYWGYNTQVTTKEAGIWAQKHWPAILIAWGVISAVVALNGWPTILHWLSGLVVTLFLIVLPFIGWVVLPFIGWVNEDSPPPPASGRSSERAVDDCTYARPCAGSTATVKVPADRSRVCFDPPVWSDPKRFGMMVSSRGVPEHRYECSVEDVVNGVCKEKPHETFRFNPRKGVTPPRHWFTNDPGIIC